jgi:tetratricopeptide (TPR) repeat protein
MNRQRKDRKVREENSSEYWVTLPTLRTLCDKTLNYLLKTINIRTIFLNLLRSFVKNNYFCTRIQKSIHLSERKVMTKEKTTKASDNLKEVEHALTTAELFFEKNAKLISIVFGAAVVVALLLLATHRFYTIPHEAKAKEQIFTAEQYFEKDSFNLTLNGDGNYPGVLDIIDNYGRTPAGNLAKYYAGISYLHIGKYKEAIDYLEGFKTNDLLLKPIATGAIGDAYAEMGNKEKAIKYYAEAAEVKINSFTTPIYLLKQGRMYEIMGNKEKALSTYQTLRDKYGDSNEGRLADKYIAHLTAVN